MFKYLEEIEFDAITNRDKLVEGGYITVFKDMKTNTNILISHSVPNGDGTYKSIIKPYFKREQLKTIKDDEAFYKSIGFLVINSNPYGGTEEYINQIFINYNGISEPMLIVFGEDETGQSIQFGCSLQDHLYKLIEEKTEFRRQIV